MNLHLLAPPEAHKAATAAELKPERTTKDAMREYTRRHSDDCNAHHAIVIVLETPMVLSMTDYAMNPAGTVTGPPLPFLAIHDTHLSF